MAYLTVDDFKARRDITSEDDDDTIALLIDAATAAIDRYTNRTFEGESEERLFDVPHGRTLWLDDDLAEITTITNGNGDDVTADQYTTRPKNAIERGRPIYAIALKSQSAVYWRSADGEYEDAITIDGVWAYSATPPADIVQAAYMLATHYYDTIDAVGSTVNVVPGTSVEIPQGMPPTVKLLLRPYVREF